MLIVNNLSVQFGKRILFDEVNVTFSPGNCYGIIGANGAGKSTFLNIISGLKEPNSGNISLEPDKRLSILEQNHNLHDEYQVLETVLMGNKDLFRIKSEMEDIYKIENFSDSDSERVGELQIKYEEMDGWSAESNAANLLSNLGIDENLHFNKMLDLDSKQKVRVLIAQALFGNPDVLIMDEPTNDLDYDTIEWLENFLCNYENTVIVVSHDRHFLDSVCTHISDIDYGKINHYSGNYSFWYESSQLAARQKAQSNKKAEEKKKELQEFISRFSANVAKSKQATSRKKMIEKLNIEEIKPSSRRYPGIIFDLEREAGDQILNIEKLAFKFDGDLLFDKVNLNLSKSDKVIFISKDTRAVNNFFDIISNRIKTFDGSFDWGITTKQEYIPLNNDYLFNKPQSLVDWLRNYAITEEEKEEVYLRGFLGKMLFTGDEALKNSNILSGGEKVRCMISKMMMSRSNVLIIDEPTNHLDLEAITAFNNALINFKGTLLFSTSDHHFAQSLANRVIELTPKGIIDRYLNFDEYMTDPKIKELRKNMYL
ncbi:MAG: ABC-F family ATPase [Flavobacteriaceae bacterium]|nr:ABC-F family ATPase [Flavobacteriaceae bacterium]|tara:strand:+ start:2263 stop:3885 length:1623 start_codon:yes stop_codon:yes gene_type:complete